MTDVCPHCKSQARAIPYYERAGNAVKRTFDGGVHEGELVCDACGGPRGTVAGEPSEGPAAELGAASRSAQLSRSSASALRTLGIGTMALGGLFALAAAAAGLGTFGIVTAVFWAVVGGGGGFLALRAAERRVKNGEQRLQAATEKALLAAAAASPDCALTATEAARILAIGVAEADRALTAMADGSRVTAEIDSDGIVHYDFRELRLALAERKGDQVRVPALEPAEEVEVPAAPAEQKEEKAR